MSFTTLPVELVKEVLTNLPQRDLTSVCLSSKPLLSIARPLLYRSIPIRLTAWRKEEEWISGHGRGGGGRRHAEEELLRRNIQQEALLEILQRNPEYKNFVIELEIIRSRAIDGRQLRKFTSSLPNIRKFTVIDENPGVDVHDDIFEHCPLAITSLDLGRSLMSPETVVDILGKRPLLVSLTLGGLRNSPLTPHQAQAGPPLGHPSSAVHLLQLPQSLTLLSLPLELFGVNRQVAQRLPNLLQLSITDDVGTWRDLDGRIQTVNRFLDTSLQLESLILRTESATLADAFERLDVLGHVPPTLKELTLDLRFWSKRYIINYVSTKAPSLQRLTLSPLLVSIWEWDIHNSNRERSKARSADGRPEREEEHKGSPFVKLCRQRGIELKWIE